MPFAPALAGTLASYRRTVQAVSHLRQTPVFLDYTLALGARVIMILLDESEFY